MAITRCERRTGNVASNRRTCKRLLMATLSLGVVSTMLAACGSDSDTGSGSEDTKVMFALGFSPNYGQAAFFAALGAGYYEDAGLEVDYVVPDSTQTAAKLTGIGRADFGEFFGLDPIVTAGQGIPVQVVSTWAWGQLGLMTLSDNAAVNDVADLKGKTVGVFDGMPYADVCRPRLLEANGLRADDEKTVSIGFDAVTPLLTKKVDASEAGSPAEDVTVELETGSAPKYFSYNEVCPAFVYGIFTNREWASKNPGSAKKFIEATIKGGKLLAEDPAQARKFFLDEFPDLDQDLVQFERWGAVQCGPDAATKGLGYNDEETYQQLIELTQEAGLVDDAPAYKDVVTDEYLPGTPITSSACK